MHTQQSWSGQRRREIRRNLPENYNAMAEDKSGACLYNKRCP